VEDGERPKVRLVGWAKDDDVEAILVDQGMQKILSILGVTHGRGRDGESGEAVVARQRADESSHRRQRVADRPAGQPPLRPACETRLDSLLAHHAIPHAHRDFGKQEPGRVGTQFEESK
jgi:hypothetical protein